MRFKSGIEENGVMDGVMVVTDDERGRWIKAGRLFQRLDDA